MSREDGQWKPGKSGNPAGRQIGARNQLNGKFIKELAADFEKHGKKAIVAVREANPTAYLQLCARFQPVEVLGEVGVSDDLAEMLRQDPRDLGRRMIQIIQRAKAANTTALEADADFPPTQGEA